MAEKFLNFQDQRRTSSPSRSLQDFEEEWLQLGRDFSVIFDSGNSPVDQSQAIDGSKKRKLSEAEDSLIISRRKLARQSEGFSQQRSQEDPQIMTLREENPNKYEALEKRTRSTLVAPKHSPASPGCSPASPGYSPASPGYIPPLTAQFLPTPDFNLLPSSTTASTTSESAQYAFGTSKFCARRSSADGNACKLYFRLHKKLEVKTISIRGISEGTPISFNTGVFHRVYWNWLNQCW